MENITFTKIKDIAGYEIYYAIPEEQRKIHINLSRTAMFVMYADQIVFIPTKNMRSRFSMEIECENWINKQGEKKMTRDEFVIAIVMVVCLAVFYAFVIGLNTYQCKTKATIQELEWSYGPIQGCMVKQENSKWIDYDHLRYMDE